jgi:hypothetical protein
MVEVWVYDRVGLLAVEVLATWLAPVGTVVAVFKHG